MKHLLPLALAIAFLPVTCPAAEPSADEGVIRQIIADEISAWDQGDAIAYSRHFAKEGTFTNIRGQFFTGYDAFLHQHEHVFESFFKHSVLHQDIVSLKFVTPDVAVVNVLTAVTGVVHPPPGMPLDQKGRLRTRLLQVIVRSHGEWMIVAYHNVDLKPGVPVPEPQ
ncbi:MAG TPA: SgcJ/EcaC family oxidoreductase [Chthoniobacterales bacterium]|jgi:uncharacterized protein (TIGR02246 family)